RDPECVRQHHECDLYRGCHRMFANTLRITIADDGVGFDLHTSKPRHFGLATMQERAQEINGIVEIVSSQGEGTVVQLSVPLTLSV
ncbi:MAG: ATP-binding protein, partial [Chloroflexota bacterium]